MTRTNERTVALIVWEEVVESPFEKPAVPRHVGCFPLTSRLSDTLGNP